ncbi:MAG: HlyC/CorC family transporter [Planctomycetes bacterium]|nr:HlyC/CorC family transporter [Planctomycetota bacterium]
MTEVLLIALFVFLSAFFSGSETGFYCLNRIRLRFRKIHGWKGAASLHKLIRRPQVAISAILIGNNITIYGATVVCGSLLNESGVTHRADLYSSLIMPPILLIFAEIIPKSLYQRRADTLMYKAASLLRFCEFVFYPLIAVLRSTLRIVRKALGEKRERTDQFTPDKLRFFLSEGASLGVLSPYQHRMAENVLRVKSLELSAAMVPLDEVAMIPESSTFEKLQKIMREHRFSRFPVYAEKRSNVTGIINVIDVLCADEDQADMQSLSRPPVYLNEKLSVGEALYILQRAHQQMAIVKSEGEVIGAVTVKDLVEEIVGELAAW